MICDMSACRALRSPQSDLGSRMTILAVCYVDNPSRQKLARVRTCFVSMAQSLTFDICLTKLAVKSV